MQKLTIIIIIIIIIVKAHLGQVPQVQILGNGMGDALVMWGDDLASISPVHLQTAQEGQI